MEGWGGDSLESPDEKADRLGVPVIGEPRKPPRPDGVVGVCGACGREVRQVEGYYCARNDCPVQLKCT